MRSLFAIAALMLCCRCADAARIKDIARLYQPGSSQAIGYGLVVGLDGTGDSRQTVFTTQSLANMLQRMGVSVSAAQMRVKNVAAVIVTCDLPPFANAGDRLDCVASSLGDAGSLNGGTLLQTPLLLPDAREVAVAQGSVSVGGFSAGAAGSKAAKNHVTAGIVPGGALVSHPLSAQAAHFERENQVRVCLRDPDVATASRIAAAINASGLATARATDPSSVEVSMPAHARPVDLLANIGELNVQPDAAAVVVVNERTGTVVIGGDVTISPVAVAHGALTVEIAAEPLISQPPPLSSGKTVTEPTAQVAVTETQASLAPVKGATVQDLISALNALKVSPRDIIAVMQAIKQAGALHADLRIM